ncbi:carboxypeptidase-like regulatory domain-containing protein [Micromonospora sp. NBC_01813]|uniref:carboxypeptidase-like regulatory domain-containing protein n=1 Tax=Micromonospora sp. NBC_01813 TaxID=2975988 RepID=UPI002DD887E1|nr:carboxypeptidase-like regulatory domain-containing protein [Micromonospora sp. NBC_01813]WSA12062.1 carboxypeptidase-like regulatory domain-containing protein [Micromonospora sp. NBC_01813]
MKPVRHALLPLLFVSLLLAGCATESSSSPGPSAPIGPDTPVSDQRQPEVPSASPGSAAGRGTAIIEVRDPAGEPLSVIPVEVRTVDWPMPAELAEDIARMTDARGEYTWTDLPPGEYEFTVRVPGEDVAAAERVTVVADETSRVPITLG